MAILAKFILFFLIYGLVWFFVFSIPVSKDESLFIVLQKTLKISGAQEQTEKTKKTINRDQVIDAISKAFDGK